MTSPVTAIYAMPRSLCIWEFRRQQCPHRQDRNRIQIAVRCQSHATELGNIVYDAGDLSPERGASAYGWWLPDITERFDSPIDALYTLESLHYARENPGAWLIDPPPSAPKQIAHSVSRANYHALFLMQGNHPELRTDTKPGRPPGAPSNGQGQSDNGA